VDLRTLVPYDAETVHDSVKKTHRALVVHEAQQTAGFGAEIAAHLADATFPWLDAPIRRVAYPDRPVPFAKALEKELLPNVDRVVEEARALVAF
jgi:pyruvate/2-oxoglutarate/acetoin dehydrogenase E1 component